MDVFDGQGILVDTGGGGGGGTIHQNHKFHVQGASLAGQPSTLIESSGVERVCVYVWLCVPMCGSLHIGNALNLKSLNLKTKM